MTEDEQGFVRLQVGIPTDPSGYLRHECPSCMLEFKLKGDEARFSDVLEWWAGRMVGRNPNGLPEAREGAMMTCPYCIWNSTPQDFLHGEYRNYLLHLAKREIVEPVLHGVFDTLEEAFSGSDHGSMSLQWKRGGRSRGPRPLAGPDADDMVRIACRACGEQFKVIAGWGGAVTCPSCSSPLVLG